MVRGHTVAVQEAGHRQGPLSPGLWFTHAREGDEREGGGSWRGRGRLLVIP